MEPAHPSVKEIQTLPSEIKMQRATDEKRRQDLMCIYFSQPIAQVQKAVTQFVQESSAHQQRISERYDIWWKSQGLELPESDLLHLHLDALVHIRDFDITPSVDDIALAFEVTWLYQDDAVVLPLVRGVAKFLSRMVTDERLPTGQRTSARTLLQTLSALTHPPLGKGGPCSNSIYALVWLHAILADYERELAKIQMIFRHRTDYIGRVSALQRAYRYIPGDKFSDWA